jgi:hypothetical protein
LLNAAPNPMPNASPAAIRTVRVLFTVS